jgi:hypothetical protein
VASTIPMAVAIVRTGALVRSGSDRDDMEGPIPALAVLMSPKTRQDGGPDQQRLLAMRPHRATIAGVDVRVRLRHVACMVAALASVLLAGLHRRAPDGRQVRPVTWHSVHLPAELEPVTATRRVRLLLGAATQHASSVPRLLLLGSGDSRTSTPGPAGTATGGAVLGVRTFVMTTRPDGRATLWTGRVTSP